MGMRFRTQPRRSAFIGREGEPLFAWFPVLGIGTRWLKDHQLPHVTFLLIHIVYFRFLRGKESFL